MVQVIFTYDETARKWEASVEGVEDSTEARQAFAAVVLTVHELNSGLLNHTKVLKRGTDYHITPAVL